MSALVVALLCAAAAAALAVPPVPGHPPVPAPGGAGSEEAEDRRSSDRGLLHRLRWPSTLLAGVGGLMLVGGTAGLVAGPGAAVACWVVLDRAEPPARRRRREQVRRDLPHAVALFAAALRSGSAPGPALVLVAQALPGPATDPGRVVAARIALGADPAQAWRWLADEPGLGPWGRAMARAHESGASVVVAVERLAADLAAQARAEVEDAARTVGVRAAVPLGLCLLPAFLLVGIVPVVAGLLDSLW